MEAKSILCENYYSLLRRYCLLLLVSISFFSNSRAQNGSPCYTPLAGYGTTAAAVQSNGLCLACGFIDSVKNITDASRSNYATFNTPAGLAAGNGVSVRDTVNTYPAGWEAGYVIGTGTSTLSLGVLGTFTIQTYNNGVLQESKDINTGVSASALSGSAGKIYLNFKTTLAFDEVRFVFSSVLGAIDTMRIYYATAFDPNCGLSYTSSICYKQIAGPSSSVAFNGGLLNALVTLTNPQNITDGDKTTYGTLTVPAGTPLLSQPVFVSVLDEQSVYPAGNKAGFMIGYSSSLLSANVLNTLSIETYLHGQLQDSVNLGTGSGITLNALSTVGGNEKEVSITTTKPFNEIRLVTDNTLGVNVDSVRIYYAFESGAACTDCRQVLTSSQASPYTGAIQASRTGIFGTVCIGQSMSGTANVVDASLTNFATYTPAILSVGCGGRISVGNGGVALPANTFAGFAISRQGTLLDLGIVNAITINLYRSGALVASSSGNSLLGGGLLNPVTGMTTIGFKSTVQFDEIQIRFDAGLINAALGGTYNIYYAFVIRDDDGDGVADCNEICGLTKNDAVDTDGDGTPDACDACNGSSFKSALADTDGDGVFDACDQDSDNDGISDIREDTNHNGDPSDDDADGDGIPNYLDLDSDNDGIPDLYESGIPAVTIATLDANHDGIIDNTVAVGTNGMANVLESSDVSPSDNNYTLADTDGDGVPDFVDLDADNDGINDIRESGRTGLTDANSDGMVDGPDTDRDGIMDSADGNNSARGGSSIANPQDTDSDGVADFRDLDSDNDGINDIIESGNSAFDTNGDGQVDGADTDGDGIRNLADNNNNAFGDAADASLPDTDGDGVADYRDLDSDNDGINDVKESGLALTADANGDGMVDGTDTDGDGILGIADGNSAAFGDASDPAAKDTDGDGVADYRDLDSDNDGINDIKESGLASAADANGDGMVDGTDTDGDGIIGVADGNTSVYGDASDPAVKDTDGDGVPDFRDLDSDNDGINDIKESGLALTADANGDGMVDGTDTDGDGIIGVADGNTTVYGDASDPAVKDTDGDGVPDYRDLDSDNDGINDVRESGLALTADANGDGMVDGTDTDGDGIIGIADGNTSVYGDASDPAVKDTDGDGVPDYRDLDSDNDGLNDVRESGLPLTADANGDGMVDGTDTDGDGIIGVADGNTSVYGDAGDITFKDTDGDGIPDARDLDSDNDGINDVQEGGLGAFDTNHDGIVDGTDTDGDGIRDNVDGQPNAFGDAADGTPVDTDGDGIPDFRDLDSDNDTISDLVESGQTGYTDADHDGVIDGPDTDGDGIQDSADGLPNTFGDAADPAPKDTDSDGTPDYRDTDSNNDGTTDIVSNGHGYQDMNGDGMVDNPTDPDGDGIPNNDGLDFKPSTFGGLGESSMLNVKVLLQGALMGTSGTVMRDSLRANGFVPLAQPYSSSAGTRFTQYGGGDETTTTAVLNASAGTGNAIVDWIFLELRSSSDPTVIVHTVSALVQRDGDVVGGDGNPVSVTLPVGTYYLSVKHRNHMGVMTATPVVTSGGSTTIDFTTISDAAVYNSSAPYDGLEMANVNGVKALWMGNVNADSKTKLDGASNDQMLLQMNVLNYPGNTGQTLNYNLAFGYFFGDVNMDGKVKHDGSGNDRSLIQTAILTYPMNTSSISNFNLMLEQIP